MELIKLSERIYMLPFVREKDRPNLFYIKGDNYSVAVDAGNSAAHVKEFYGQLKKYGLEMPKYTVITHWHWDHTFGLHAICGKSIASVKTNEKLRQVMKWEWTREKMREREASGEDIAFCNECILMEYENLDEIKVVMADEVVQGEKTLDLGDVHLHLTARNSTHSRDALFVYVPEEKALILGDADCEDPYENGGKYDADRLSDLTEFLKGIYYQRHLISHDFEESKEEALEYLSEALEKLVQ